MRTLSAYEFTVQASVGEHANLVDNVRPVARSAILLEQIKQCVTHGLDATRHLAQVIFPLGEQLGIWQHTRDDVGSVTGRVGVHGTNDGLELRAHCLNSVRGVRSEHHVQSTAAFRIEAKVLGERLGDEQVKWAITYERTKSFCVLNEGTRGESLISAVKERDVTAGFEQFFQLAPLLRGRINSGGIVSACVKQDNAAVRGILNCC